MLSQALVQEIKNTFQIAASRCTTEEIVFVCPEPNCGDTGGNRSLNIRTGLTSCWRCGKGRYNKGNFIAWARANGYNFTNKSDAYSSVDTEATLYEESQVESKVPYVKPVKLPDGFVYLRDEPNSGYAKLIGRMAVRKNLTLKDLIQAGAGFTRGDNLWEPFCIFPVKELGHNVYYQGRTYVDPEDGKTKKFPSKLEVPYGASCWIYGYDELCAAKAPTVVVVEAILSVLSLRKELKARGITDIVPVCVFKHSVSTVQAIKLFRCKWLKEVCLMFDHDAIDATWAQTHNVGNKLRITVAEIASAAGNKKLDPNDSPELAMQAFEARKPYNALAVVERFLDVKPVLSASKYDYSRCIRKKVCS